MAAEPINIFSHRIDPAGVLETLKRLAPDLHVEGPPDNWQQITIIKKTGFFKKAVKITFGHDRNYYAGPDWSKQVRGMQGYFSRFKPNESTARIMLLIQSFRFSLALFPIPEPDLSLGSNDQRLEYLFAVVKHLDGVIFTPSSLRDASGRMLYGAGDPDLAAVMPAIFRTVTGPRSARKRAEGGDVPNDDDPQPPTPQKVARRMLAITAVTARASLENEPKNDPHLEVTRHAIMEWVGEIGIIDEFEPDEIKLLQHPIGTPPEHDIFNAMWQLEDLAILGWALHLFDPPPYDKLVDPDQLVPILGILNAEKAKSILRTAQLRSPEELEVCARNIFAIHWRLRDFKLRPRAIDYKKFADTAWFGKMPLDNVRLINGDLAIDGVSIADAPRNAVLSCENSAQRRHVAINWLRGYSSIYSQTDSST